MIRYSVLVALSLLMLACEGPFTFFSGGELNGTVTEPPGIWQFEEQSGLAQLETRPEDPYSINFAYVQLNDHLYAYAGDTRTNWVQHIEQNPLVRVRIGETIYPLHAVRVDEGDELDEFAEVWASHSTFQRDPKQFDEVWLYRLERR